MSRIVLTAALAAAGLLTSPAALAGKDLDAIKSRGALVCGVNVGLAGFSATDSQGKWTGLDVDYCRALAAVILGDGNKVRFVPLTAQQRFTALQSGEIDVLSPFYNSRPGTISGGSHEIQRNILAKYGLNLPS